MRLLDFQKEVDLAWEWEGRIIESIKHCAHNDKLDVVVQIPML
jgi:hypothetical protein